MRPRTQRAWVVEVAAHENRAASAQRDGGRRIGVTNERAHGDPSFEERAGNGPALLARGASDEQGTGMDSMDMSYPSRGE